MFSYDQLEFSRVATVMASADSKLSPMTAYKVRKILLSQIGQNDLFSVSPSETEANVDLDKMLATLYTPDERVFKVRELEALTTCYQTLLNQASPHNPEIQELEKQILSILQVEVKSDSTSSRSVQVKEAELGNSFEVRWLSKPECRTIEDVLDILNALLQFSARYIGPQIAQRTFLSVRPTYDWLTRFSIEEKGKVSFAGSSADLVSSEDLTLIQYWVSAYIESASYIVGNLRELLSQGFTRKR